MHHHHHEYHEKQLQCDGIKPLDLMMQGDNFRAVGFMSHRGQVDEVNKISSHKNKMSYPKIIVGVIIMPNISS